MFLLLSGFLTLITIKSQKTGQNEQYSLGTKLGEGIIGNVYALKDKREKETNLVCKKVDVANTKSFLSKTECTYFTLNELRILKKLALLE
jgi:hypothetical protein